MNKFDLCNFQFYTCGQRYDMKQYIALIGDMIDSRSLANRSIIQKKFKQVLEDINSTYSDQLASPFMVTIGDEFQGLLAIPDHVLAIIETIAEQMFPIRFRFGIGIGEITTEIDKTMPLGADGPAYYRARNCITDLHDRERRNGKAIASMQIKSNRKHQDSMINAVFLLMIALKSHWTYRQREIVARFRQLGKSQQDTAKELKISQPSVSKTVKAADYFAYLEAMEAAQQSIDDIFLQGQGQGNVY